MLTRAASSARAPGARALVTLINSGRTLTLPALEDHTASVVFLHGLGDTAQGWLQPAEYLQARCPQTRWVLPTAPESPVTVNMGMPMPSWFDITGQGLRDTEPCAGLDESCAAVAELVRAEIEAVGAERVVLGGFSQGGAVSLHLGLGLADAELADLAGVLSLSAFLPRLAAARARASLPEGSKRAAVQMCHGDADPMVELAWAQKSHALLAGRGVPSALEVFPGLTHSASVEELDFIVTWLQARLPPR